MLKFSGGVLFLFLGAVLVEFAKFLGSRGVFVSSLTYITLRFGFFFDLLNPIPLNPSEILLVSSVC
jgi:hypothetical protein